MEEGSINKVAKDLDRYKQLSEVEPAFKVAPTEKTEQQKTDDSTTNPNETLKNIHPTLGHNIDIKA